MSKWDVYYADAVSSGVPPPWESPDPFSGLVSLLQQEAGRAVIAPGMKALEIGCGSSASAAYLSLQGLSCTAVDVCPLAIERARILYPTAGTKWAVGNIFSPDFPEDAGSYDFVFDMQCFHILREVDEARVVDVVYTALKTGGHAMVVAGAVPLEGNVEPPLSPGPPRLTRNEVVQPFLHRGFELVDISRSRFNGTPTYSKMSAPPECWVAIFRKPSSPS